MSIAPVQSVSQAFASSTGARSLATSGAVTAGNLLVVCVATYGVTVTVAMADDVNGSYTQAGTYASNNPNEKVSIWYFPNAGAGITTVTVTPTIGVGAAYVDIAIQEYSGCPTTSPLNSTNSSTGTSTTPTTGTVTASSGELIIGIYSQGGGTLSSATVASPFTVREQNLNGSTLEGFGTADDTNASGSEGATWTLSASVNWQALGASFKTATPPAAPIGKIVMASQAVAQAPF